MPTYVNIGAVRDVLVYLLLKGKGVPWKANPQVLRSRFNAQDDLQAGQIDQTTPPFSYIAHLVKYILHDGEKSRRSASVEVPLLAESVIVVVEIEHHCLLVRQVSRESFIKALSSSYLAKAEMQRQQAESRKTGGCEEACSVHFWTVG